MGIPVEANTFYLEEKNSCLGKKELVNQTAPICSLPLDVLFHIFSFFKGYELAPIQKTSHFFYQILSSGHRAGLLWQRLFEQEFYKTQEKTVSNWKERYIQEAPYPYFKKILKKKRMFYLQPAIVIDLTVQQCVRTVARLSLRYKIAIHDRIIRFSHDDKEIIRVADRIFVENVQFNQLTSNLILTSYQLDQRHAFHVHFHLGEWMAERVKISSPHSIHSRVFRWYSAVLLDCSFKKSISVKVGPCQEWSAVKQTYASIANQHTLYIEGKPVNFSFPLLGGGINDLDPVEKGVIEKGEGKTFYLTRYKADQMVENSHKEYWSLTQSKQEDFYRASRFEKNK